MDDETIINYERTSNKLTFGSSDIAKNVDLTPQAMLAFNQQSEPIVGEYFIGSDDLTFGNLFNQKIANIRK